VTNLQSPNLTISAANTTAYGRNFDGKPGDVLARLEEMLATTPPSSLATRPMRRALLEATINEIKQLRSALAAPQKGD
jgi:hypothetical protein